MPKLTLVGLIVFNVNKGSVRRMSKQERIKNILVDENHIPPTFLENFDDGLIGIIRDEEKDTSTPVYSYLKLIEILLEDGISEEDAVEYVDNAMSQWSESVVILDDTGV